jgi:hypothetical protein
MSKRGTARTVRLPIAHAVLCISQKISPNRNRIVSKCDGRLFHPAGWMMAFCAAERNSRLPNATRVYAKNSRACKAFAFRSAPNDAAVCTNLHQLQLIEIQGSVEIIHRKLECDIMRACTSLPNAAELLRGRVQAASMALTCKSRVHQHGYRIHCADNRPRPRTVRYPPAESLPNKRSNTRAIKGTPRDACSRTVVTS